MGTRSESINGTNEQMTNYESCQATTCPLADGVIRFYISIRHLNEKQATKRHVESLVKSLIVSRHFRSCNSNE